MRQQSKRRIFWFWKYGLVRIFDELPVWDRGRRPCFKDRAAREFLLPCRLSVLNRIVFLGSENNWPEKSAEFSSRSRRRREITRNESGRRKCQNTSAHFEMNKEKRGRNAGKSFYISRTFKRMPLFTLLSLYGGQGTDAGRVKGGRHLLFCMDRNGDFDEWYVFGIFVFKSFFGLLSES